MGWSIRTECTRDVKLKRHSSKCIRRSIVSTGLSRGRAGVRFISPREGKRYVPIYPGWLRTLEPRAGLKKASCFFFSQNVWFGVQLFNGWWTKIVETSSWEKKDNFVKKNHKLTFFKLAPLSTLNLLVSCRLFDVNRKHTTIACKKKFSLSNTSRE